MQAIWWVLSFPLLHFFIPHLQTQLPDGARLTFSWPLSYIYFFIFYLPRCTLPDFPSVSFLASLPFLSFYRTTCEAISLYVYFICKTYLVLNPCTPKMVWWPNPCIRTRRVTRSRWISFVNCLFRRGGNAYHLPKSCHILKRYWMALSLCLSVILFVRCRKPFSVVQFQN